MLIEPKLSDWMSDTAFNALLVNIPVILTVFASWLSGKKQNQKIEDRVDLKSDELREVTQSTAKEKLHRLDEIHELVNGSSTEKDRRIAEKDRKIERLEGQLRSLQAKLDLFDRRKPRRRR